MDTARRMALQHELDRLTLNDKPERKAQFAEGYWRSVRTWEERLVSKERAQAIDDLKAALLERILVTEHRGSPQYAEAMREDFVRRTQRAVGRSEEAA